jgi:hypothetical protein
MPRIHGARMEEPRHHVPLTTKELSIHNTNDDRPVATVELTTTTTTSMSSMSMNVNVNAPHPVTPEAKQDGEEKENGRHFNIMTEDASLSPDSPTTPVTTTAATTNNNKKYEDVSSSDDDSSYFATHLPAPNSRRGSFVSGSSFYQNSLNGSNASLSFSDDESEDDEENKSPMVHMQSMIAAAAAAAAIETTTATDMHLFPQRITRMHSVSSLVSSASSEDGQRNLLLQKPSVESMSSPSTSNTLPPDGRRSPVMGQAAYFFASPNRLPSPPPPIAGYAASPSGSMIHPQPLQPLQHQQQQFWHQFPPPTMYGSTMLMGTGGFQTFAAYQGGETYDTMDPLVNQLSSGGSGGGMQSSNGLTNRNMGGGNDPSRQQQQQQQPQPSRGTGTVDDGAQAFSHLMDRPGGGGGQGALEKQNGPQDEGFKVYWQRWIMLFYMSVLNLLSDWTCYSVAPIALLTEEAFGNIDAERLVVVFLGANAMASACEPIILARLGLRKTVLFGSLMLMIGSLVKSGGIPPIIPSDLRVGHDEWRLYLGFFLVGLSQPLYQCTPALLSASWFPEKERTMATGVALNANQLGIGFAFIFGTLLVSDADDIPNYFGLLTLLSTIAFLGTLIQFDDAPPTPPSSSARVMRGSVDINLPNFDDIMQSVRAFGTPQPPNRANRAGNVVDDAGISPAPSPADGDAVARKGKSETSKQKRDTKARKRKGSGSTRRRAAGARSTQSGGLLAPSPAMSGQTSHAMDQMQELRSEALRFGVTAPSPAMSGRVGQTNTSGNERSSPPAEAASTLYSDAGAGQDQQQGLNMPPPMGDNPALGHSGGYQGGMPPPGMAQPYGGFPPHQYPYWDPRVQQQLQQQQAAYQQQFYYYQQQQMQMSQPPPPQYPIPSPYLNHLQGYDWQHTNLPAADAMDEGVEPIITLTPHHLDIDIRDDQVVRSIRACLSRPGFVHALVAFTVSGIVINTLSTYMDYLVRLNGAPRYYTGVVGGTFQFVIMISSLIIGKQTDKTRAYYSVTIGMLVLGAFGLAECGVSLDENNGRDLRWALVIVAALVGPLQPVSTELGVDVAYPLSENTVLVIQQLFSNLLSALFIPIFKALKDVGKGDEIDERPEYTFSFYLLIVLHTAATVFFATFNGKYLRYEHELQKKEQQEREAQQAMMESGTPKAFHPFYADRQEDYGNSFEDERRPLVGS